MVSVGDTLAATRSDIRSGQDHCRFRQGSRFPSGRSIPERLAVGYSIRSTRQRRRVGLIPQAYKSPTHFDSVIP